MSKCIKGFGITVQTNLKLDQHVNSMTQTTNQSLCFLRGNIKTNSQDIKEHAYKHLVRPNLEYASSVWDPQINHSEHLQIRAARHVCRIYHNYTSSATDLEMIALLKWPSLDLQTMKTYSRFTLFTAPTGPKGHLYLHMLQCLSIHPDL